MGGFAERKDREGREDPIPTRKRALTCGLCVVSSNFVLLFPVRLRLEERGRTAAQVWAALIVLVCPAAIQGGSRPLVWVGGMLRREGYFSGKGDDVRMNSRRATRERTSSLRRHLCLRLGDLSAGSARERPHFRRLNSELD